MQEHAFESRNPRWVVRRHCPTALGTPTLSSPTRLARVCRAPGLRASAHLREWTVHRLGNHTRPVVCATQPGTLKKNVIATHVRSTAARSLLFRPLCLRALLAPCSHQRGRVSLEFALAQGALFRSKRWLPPACVLQGPSRGELGAPWAMFVPDRMERGGVSSAYAEPDALCVGVLGLGLTPRVCCRLGGVRGGRPCPAPVLPSAPQQAPSAPFVAVLACAPPPPHAYPPLLASLAGSWPLPRHPSVSAPAPCPTGRGSSQWCAPATRRG